MEKPYTIGEIGKLLGLSRDAIRFYERKGLVHPLINSNNRYRLYTFKNVLELLDIIYYRHLDIPVDTIYDLSKDMDPKRIVSLMDEKVRQTRRKIYYETQLLKKLEHIQLMFHEIERQKNVCSIKQFPTSLILFQGKDKEAFFSHDIQYLTQDQFVLGALYIEFELDSIKEKRMFVTLEQSVLQEMDIPLINDQLPLIALKSCVHLAVRMKEGIIHSNDIDRIKQFAQQHDLKLENTCLVREIPITFYKDMDHYYAEIFVPIKQSA